MLAYSSEFPADSNQAENEVSKKCLDQQGESCGKMTVETECIKRRKCVWWKQACFDACWTLPQQECPHATYCEWAGKSCTNKCLTLLKVDCELAGNCIYTGSSCQIKCSNLNLDQCGPDNLCRKYTKPHSSGGCVVYCANYAKEECMKFTHCTWVNQYKMCA